MAQGNNISATNSFEGGIVTDLHNLTSASNTVVDSLNMELVTVGDDQYIYQNIRGNKLEVEFPFYTYEGKQYRFSPQGLKVHNNIAYILVGAFKPDGTFLAGAVGTYPSPDWAVLNSGDSTTHTRLENKFRFLHNYKKPGDVAYKSPFISTLFEFERNRHIDIDIQGDFDSSVNILFTDSLNNPSIINSRFKRVDFNELVQLADRTGTNDSNTYSDSDWDRITLIQNTNFPVEIVDDNGDKGFTVAEGGYLRGGGYRYYFKYTTQEGNTTEILYESPLIPISNGGLGLDKSQLSDKLVRFTLRKLDSSYTGIKVFFAHFDGKDQAEMEVFKIDYVYTYGDESTTVVTHTGLEDVTAVDATEINVGFTPIDTVKSAVIINDRLALAGASSTISERDLDILRKAAIDITLWEKQRSLEKIIPNANKPEEFYYPDYSDAETAANSLGYWKGEVYEFAAVFMLKNKGLSPAFPLTGMDNLIALQNSFTYPNYPDYTGLIKEDGFADGSLINNKGLFRTSNKGLIYTPLGDGDGIRHITYLNANVAKLSEANNPDLHKISSGFFIVRRQRIKNVLIQGMAIPVIKLPAKYPSLYEGVLDKQASLSASKRYLIKHFGGDDEDLGDDPTIGLNAPYKSGVRDGEALFNDDFNTVFVPQPTQILNTLTAEKAWIVSGAVSQYVSTLPPLLAETQAPYGETVDKDNKRTGDMHLGFYSCEMELNFPNIKSYLNGIDPEMEIQYAKNNESPVGYTYTGYKYRDNPNTVTYIAEPVSMDRSGWSTIPSKAVKATILESGRSVYSNGSFSSKTDRALGFMSDNITDTDPDAAGDGATKITYGLPYKRFTGRDGIYNILASTSKVAFNVGFIGSIGSFHPYSVISNSYSRYMGVKINLEDIQIAPEFYYKKNLLRTTETLLNNTNILKDPSGELDKRYFVNTGHLANVFRSATGRWGETELRTIYKYDSNKAYHAVTDRTPLDIEGGSIDIYRGDGFISRIFKKTSYKNGVPSSKSATSADATDYGVGLVKNESSSIDQADLNESERDDLGRNLFDVGQVIEIATYSNINADIRSTEKLSEEDSLLYGGDRDFFPNKEDVFGDARPDATSYNHGYTGEDNPISYSRIEEYSPSFNTEFPNRVLLSERNKTQSFFNSFRDLKGFNYRDYGVELGPIVKLASIKNLLLTIHPTGVLAIGVDDRTLVAEGSDVYVNTAQSLSPTAKTISDIYGSVHPESVVKTDTTVAGVDYNASAVWIFQGEKLSIISEFAIKTLLEKFKSAITSGGFRAGDQDISYNARVYSTFNHSKHTLYISYVAEHPQDKLQYHVGTVSYSTVLQKWMSRVSEGNKFSMFIGAHTYTTGFKALNGAIEQADYAIWKEDALVNNEGKGLRARLRGIDYKYEFEIVVNKEPALEKVLNNIRMITNKSIPITVEYITTGDENDAAVDIWGAENGERKVTQKIITRNKSARKALRLGILDENAYYKNSGLYIEVGRINSILRKNIGNKRIRDKSIRVRFIYSGNDETFLQGIISMLSISHS